MTMKTQTSDETRSADARRMSLLSELMFAGNALAPGELLPASKDEFAQLLDLANKHHVIMRVMPVLENIARAQGNEELQAWCQSAVAKEKARIRNAVEWLFAIVQCLQNAGCAVCVIKSLDHWPDLGSDLDLYTSCSAERVCQVMHEKLQAKQEPRSWGDKLAGKWNFEVPGLPELIEIHVRYLGQTGEQKLMARRVLERSVTKTVNGRSFPVPAPEERILISTLQRMYRHFYFRLCDMADMSTLIQAGAVDFAELKRGADVGGIWPGVASFLVIVAEYVQRFGGKLELPAEVQNEAYSQNLRVHFSDTFLRVPMGPAAGLYGSQLLAAGKKGDMRAISRLPLLPPLAASALLAYRITGSDKGVW